MMIGKGWLLLLGFLWLGAGAQTNEAVKLQQAWVGFMGDAQLKFAQAGICVLDANTGKIIFEKNAQTGLVPASTQKVLTSVAAFEALGASFQYKTNIAYQGTIANNKLVGNLIFKGSGDPTLGSWRYAITKEDIVVDNLATAMRNVGILQVNGAMLVNDSGFNHNPTPGGWQWNDVGNYYGAGHWAFNWRENQYDLMFNTGSTENDATTLVGETAAPFALSAFVNEVKTGKPGTGDGSVIYGDAFNNRPLIQGRLEPNRKQFVVSGATPNADLAGLGRIQKLLLQQQQVKVDGAAGNLRLQSISGIKELKAPVYFHQINSPTLDSIVYWFMKKSINLYGEALLKTIGLVKKGEGDTDAGIDWLTDFYASNGVHKDALHMEDGSGLSPANRVTPFALTQALKVAQGKEWFPYFYDALPLYNGMKLKSGTIKRVKCYAGYHTAANGKKYIVSLMVNNYNGSHASLLTKMYQVLDQLK